MVVHRRQDEFSPLISGNARNLWFFRLPLIRFRALYRFARHWIILAVTRDFKK